MQRECPTAVAGRQFPMAQSMRSKPTAPFQATFEAFPKHLRVGAWSWVAYLYIVVVLCALVLSPLLFQIPTLETLHAGSSGPSDYLPSSVAAAPRTVSAILSLYMVAVLMYMVRTVGVWPFASYTMISWSFTTLRHLSRAAAVADHIREVIHFPAVATTCVTVLIWWSMIMPAVYFLACRTAESKRRFLAFNARPFLLNVHILNFPLMLVDHLLEPRKFCPTDLWIGLTYGMAYLIFYLLVLDANGAHFYIVFSPRTPLCFIPYTLVLVLHYSIWRMI